MNARWIAIVACALGLSACGGSSSSGTTTTPPPPATYTLGGTVTGLAGAGLVLGNNGVALAVGAGSTSFTFANALTTGTAYAVTVQSSPNGQTCSVANGTGTMGTANISNVVVTCSNQSYSIGGSISGLNGTGLVLANGTDQLTVSSGSTSFTLPTKVAFSSTYQVTVATQPSGLSCSVQNGTGTMGAGNVTNIAVSCTDQPYALGGTISGLASTGLKLTDGTDTVQIDPTATTFVFPTRLTYSSSYTVAVASQPVGMMCSVTSGTGTMPAGDVTTVAVVCSDRSYSLGGTIAGLTTSGLKLTDGTDTLTISANATSFVFPTAVAFSTNYSVSVANQPVGLTCSPSNASGQMGAADVSNVGITCSVNSYTLGGSISGLTFTGLVLTDGTDQVAPAANATSFTMTPHSIAYGSPYSVTVAAQPPGVSCSVTNGSGTMPAGNVSNVQVACAPFVWTWEAGTPTADEVGSYPSPARPSARNAQMAWKTSDGKFWFFGGSTTDSMLATGDIDDVWSYDPTGQQWTFAGGSHTVNAAINTGPGTLTPGARHAGAVWVDANGLVWLFGGQDSSQQVYNDLWTFNTTTHVWTYMGAAAPTPDDAGNYGPSGTLVPRARAGAATWIDAAGKFWLFGGASIDPGPVLASLNDLWTFDPTNQQWTLVSGTGASNASGVYPTSPGQAGSSNVPGARGGATAWVDGSGRLWLFGGLGLDSVGTAGSLNDFWSYSTSTHQWTWVGGANTVASAGTYGTQGTGSTTNIPGAREGSTSWVDSDGRLWLFGGADLIGGNVFNDLWAFDPTSSQWTWVGGANAPSTSPGIYGTLGTGAGTNQPGARYLSSGWADNSGHLWLFGGKGYDGATPTANFGNLNDVWKF